MRILLISIITLACLSGFSCNLINGTQRRLNDEAVVMDLRAIRNAEADHRQLFGRYGSIEDLVENRVLGERFLDRQEYW